MEKMIFTNKLKIDRLFVKVPINLKCMLSQNERDFLEAIIHLQSLGKVHTSDSLVMANSGLNSNQITNAKRNLIALGLLNVKSNKGAYGSIYIINTERYNTFVEQLNAIPNASQRFETGDNIRKECGLNAIFSNIVNTLRRTHIGTTLTDEECLRMASLAPTYAEQKSALKELLEKQEITIEEYRYKCKKLS